MNSPSPEVFRTARGTRYLKEPGVTLLSRPEFDVMGLKPFLDGFDSELEFGGYLDDHWPGLSSATALVKAAGQLCYMSFGPKRSKNADARKYVDNLLESGHGSVLEHATFVLLFWGQDRAVTHEEVRHRHHGFSQVSQRYVSGATLRFVEAREFQGNAKLHEVFERDIDAAATAYEERIALLLEAQGGNDPALSGESKTEMRKKVQQAARRVLPNETEAPIVISGNIRAWRNFIDQRASQHADVSIREPAVRAWRILVKEAPLFFDDYKTRILPDGSTVLDGKYRKV